MTPIAGHPSPIDEPRGGGSRESARHKQVQPPFGGPPDGPCVTTGLFLPYPTTMNVR